jgi:glycosidase
MVSLVAPDTPMINDLWYKNAIIYCLSVSTYMDASGDGIGDFQGLMRRLDYLHGLGVTAVWLMPFQVSPLRDDGYDVADYYGVDPRYGTLGDFVEFTRAAKQRGIRVLIDLVVNHTSNEHPWFKEARKQPNSKYRDWYIWSKRKPPRANHGMVFPGVFHRFYDFQPDLNTSHLASADIGPLVAALKRTKKRRATAQWATFLRNHDELDLARLTKQQRQAVFDAFAPKKDMQLYDRGVRRRLANAATQRRHPVSFLNWTERIIRMRKELPEIGWGNFEILPSKDSAVLIMRYDWRNNSVLFVHNFDSKPREISFSIGLSDPGVESRLLNLLSEDHSRGDKDGKHRLVIEGYGYRWYRIGGLGQRFHGSNHIRQARRDYRTRCG